MADSTNNLPQIVAGSGAAQRVNDMFAASSPAALYAMNPTTTTGLTWGFLGGRYKSTLIANATLTLTASATNYIVAAKTNGAVSVSTALTNWDNRKDFERLYSIVTGTAAITSYEDHRGPMGALGFDMRIDNTAPTIELRETDQALPAGLWRTLLDGNLYSLQRNTAAAGDFSTLQNALQFDANGTASFANTVTASITGTASNITGIAAVANGGTGATTEAAARANLNVPTRTGGDASGTWGISVTGNAGTVTNGVYTTGAQSIAGTKTFTDNPRIENAAPNLIFRENDQTLPAGLWRTMADGGNWLLQRNTAAAGDFSTLLNQIVVLADGKVGLGTVAPQARFSISDNLRLFDVTPVGAEGSTNAGYLFGTSIPSGLATEVNGEVLSLAINVPQIGTRNTTRVGGIFRLDTRAGFESFSIFGYAIGSAQATERLNINLNSGNATFNCSTVNWPGNPTHTGNNTFSGAMALTGDHARPLTMQRSTVAVTAPGAGNAALRWETGTNAGTLRLVAYSGTSTTGSVIMDNIGAGN